MIGHVESGVQTLTNFQTEHAQRIALPSSYSWPVRTCQLKRCLLTQEIPLKGTDRKLILVNLHLEAYESGEGRIAQTKQLLDLMEEEFSRGNYVIAGGDFNQSFPNALEVFPIADPEKWTPGILEENILPDGWQFAYDTTTATCRLLDQPYCDACQLYVIDGFILSPNLRLETVETIDMDFEYSDHNPVRLNVSLIP